jgi:hypothetical protein
MQSSVLIIEQLVPRQFLFAERPEYINHEVAVAVVVVGGSSISISVSINVKINFTIEQTTKVQKGNRGIALLFL